MKPCFECQTPTTGKHHVVPRSMGGTKTLPLCLDCHAKVHDRLISSSALVLAGLDRARASGKILGRPIKFTADLKIQALSLADSGFSQRQIARQLHLSVGSINEFLNT